MKKKNHTRTKLYHQSKHFFERLWFFGSSIIEFCKKVGENPKGQENYKIKVRQVGLRGI